MTLIKSVLNESRLFRPEKEFVERANVSGLKSYTALIEEATQNYEGFWARLANENLSWKKPFTQTLDSSQAPFFKWFSDGLLNASYNCLDRHLETIPNKTAIIFESDEGHVTKVTYRELHRQVCVFANGLRSLGITKGDRVIIYMPMSIEGVVAMQACARIGAIHSVVFGGFSAKSLHERIVDAEAKCVITADAGHRGGKIVALKPAVDEAIALDGGTECVKSVIVYHRSVTPVQWFAERDIHWHELIKGKSDVCEPEWVEAEHPLFILYTSGSTGKPKGVQHSTAGYLLGTQTSMKWVFDYRSNDIFWCTADIGWITGHSYVAYGPLGVGATQVIFEGVPTWPDAGRFWQMIERHKVTTFYTAPTAIRSLIKAGEELPLNSDLSSLRLLGSVGEPINPEAWIWYYEKVGQKRCPVVDTWWQTETGSHMIAPLPGVTALKPGSCTQALPGIFAAIVDETGQDVEPGKSGILVIKRPFPSLLRTLWKDPARFKQSYFPEELGGTFYLAGDAANRDLDGFFWIMGRIDDVLNVSGHRLGTMEIESALVGNALVAEAAVVGRPHEIKGEAIVAYVVLKKEIPSSPTEAHALAEKLKLWVASEIGALAKPEEIRFTEQLPKTRSGKIMRRLLRSIAQGNQTLQDVSTLENPAILEQLKKAA